MISWRGLGVSVRGGLRRGRGGRERWGGSGRGGWIWLRGRIRG